MKYLASLLLFISFVLPSFAEDSPTLTGKGLEEYQMGKPAPSESDFPGLTHLRVQQSSQEEGETVVTTYLKLFLQGRYLGKARLDAEGLVDELTIISPEVRHAAGYSVGQTWDSVARVFPMGKLYYTYISDWLFVESEAVGHLQLHFDKSDYQGSSTLDGELQELHENDLSDEAQLKSIRLYWAPTK